jgi:hypothetical protein
MMFYFLQAMMAIVVCTLMEKTPVSLILWWCAYRNAMWGL